MIAVAAVFGLLAVFATRAWLANQADALDITVGWDFVRYTQDEARVEEAHAFFRTGAQVFERVAGQEGNCRDAIQQDPVTQRILDFI